MTTELGFELVYFVLGYWDQPRDGIADYRGTPHRFSCAFDHELDDYPDQYLLKPIGREALLLELEAHQLYYRHGPCPEMSHPQGETFLVFPETKPRFDAIQKELEEDRRETLDAIRAKALFRRRPSPPHWNGRTLWEVRWMPES
jgi:hypothetical protein